MRLFGKKEETVKTEKNKSEVSEKTYPNYTSLYYKGEDFPQVEYSDGKIPDINEDMPDFNSIVEIDDIKYRISSLHSKEIVRTIGIGKSYTFEDYAYNYDTGERNCGRVYFLRSEETYYFRQRLCMTDSGNYVIQTICSDGGVRVGDVSRKVAQDFISRCEHPEENKKLFQNGRFVVDKPMSKDIKTLQNYETVHSFVVTNKDLYDKVIPLY